jgi:putative cell wall-binding protein
MIHSATFRRLLGIVTALTLVAAFAAPAAAIDGDRYVALTNEKRASVDLGPVGRASAVDSISDERALQLAKADDLEHDLDYVAQRLKAYGICYTTFGEIIAYEGGYATYDPARTIKQWWESDGHHAIMVGNYSVAGGSHRPGPAPKNRTYSVMVFVKLCAPTSSSDTDIRRLAGGDRYATAAAISRSRFGGGASTVFIATGGSFPDALAGSPAAAKANGPILLTGRDSLPAATATELDRLNPSKIVILGGTGSVSTAVASRLGGYADNLVRWAGADRFATAAAISRASFAPGVAAVYIATGSTFPDALSGGAVAGRNGGPILLVKRGALPSATATELDRLNPGKIIILGGTGAVSNTVADAVRRFATSGTVTRLAGADRYATSVVVSRSSYGSSGSDAVFVATGGNFPDGLAGGPVAALLPGPLLLVSKTTLPGIVANELERLNPDKVFVLGGTGSVSDAVVRSIDATLP